jgi:uncharacterized protein YndB with AHSA1/START domain
MINQETIIMNKTFMAEASITITASPAQVWEALTDPYLIKQYLFGTEVTTDWRVGHPITYTGDWEGKAYEDKGEVIEKVVEKLLVTTYWSSLSGLPDIPEYYKTVRYELSPAGNGTKLTITQDNNDSREDADHSEENWKSVLGGIKKLLEE